MKKISGVLNTRISQVAGRFVSRYSTITDLERAFQDIHYRTMLAELFEHLLLFDEVAIVMNVDNSPLGILISEFGINDTANLIETGAIKLILRRVILTSKVGDIKNHITEFNGIPPVISGMIEVDNLFGNPTHCIDDAFKYVHYNYSRKERDMFSKRILPFIIIDSGNTGEKAVKILIDAYHSNSLSAVNLPYLVHENSLNHYQRSHMLKLAHELTDLMLIASNNYGMYNQESMYNIASKAVGEIMSAVNISNSMEKIVTVAERMPNLKALYLMDKVGFHSVFNIRQQSDSKLFRDWINTKTKEDDAEYIIKQYIDDCLIKEPGFFGTTKGKLVKSMVSYGISIGVGGAVTALLPVSLTVGMASGIVGTKVIEHVSNEFLNGLFKSLTAGWIPRQYLDTIRNTIND